MQNESNVEDVAQSETNEDREVLRRGYKLREMTKELPTEEEAEMGELFKAEEGDSDNPSQFEELSLVDDETDDLIEAVEGGDD